MLAHLGVPPLARLNLTRFRSRHGALFRTIPTAPTGGEGSRVTEESHRDACGLATRHQYWGGAGSRGRPAPAAVFASVHQSRRRRTVSGGDDSRTGAHDPLQPAAPTTRRRRALPDRVAVSAPAHATATTWPALWLSTRGRVRPRTTCPSAGTRASRVDPGGRRQRPVLVQPAPLWACSSGPRCTSGATTTSRSATRPRSSPTA